MLTVILGQEGRLDLLRELDLEPEEGDGNGADSGGGGGHFLKLEEVDLRLFG